MSVRKPENGTVSGIRRERRRSAVAPLAIALACVIAVLTGLLSIWMVPVASMEAVGSGLRFSEIMAANGSALTLPDGTQPDWIEIENASDTSVDLTGYAILTQSKPSKAFAFPGGLLGPGERILIYCDGSSVKQVDGEFHAPFKLSASGETIALLDQHGVGMDAVTTPALSRDQVYCRDEAGGWSVSEQATPGEANAPGTGFSEGQTEGLRVVSGAVEITEVMTRNATYLAETAGEHPDYIEIHNRSASPVSLEGWSLSDARERLRKWTFPAVTLPADGYMTVLCCGVDDPEHLSAGFRLNAAGEEIFLTDPDGVTTAWVQIPALSGDQAYSLTDSGWSAAKAPSPGQPNDREGAEAASSEILQRNGFGIYITELMASAVDSDDWIEIYNASAQAVDLTNFGLSDNASKPRKWQFPNGAVIEPGGYLTVFADHKALADDGMLHADFRLSLSGGYPVTLCDPEGHIFDRLFVPEQYQNIAYGRTETLTGVRYFQTPTPGAANSGQSSLGRAPLPEYSTRGGLFHSGDVVTVELRVPQGCQVYYTLDCTDPTQASTRYTNPISINGTTILRTRVYGEGYLDSYMDTQSYLYDVNNGNGTVYVASLVSDPYNLTSDEAGIMAMGPNALPEYPHGSKGKGANFWMNWEREAHIEVFRPDGSGLLSQECGVRLHGNSSRPQDQKAFKILARSAYGSNRFHAALFTRRPYTEYKAFLLRTGSQDIKKTHMRDEILQSLAANLHLMYQEYEVAQVYLNGEYWGHYNIREMVNTASICQFEGWEGDEDALDFINKDRIILQGSSASLDALYDWLKNHDVTSEEAYQVMDAAVDLENYLQYIALEMYIGNYDSQNIKCYRNPNADGKWRWVLYDLDCGFDIDTNSVRRWLDPAGMGRDKDTDNRLFIACIKNPHTREMFLSFLGHEMATTYSADHIVGMIEDYSALVAPILPDQLARWNLSREEYDKEVDKLIAYAKTRPMRMLQFLKGSENLHLTREEMERYFSEAISQSGVTYDEIKAE